MQVDISQRLVEIGAFLQQTAYISQRLSEIGTAFINGIQLSQRLVEIGYIPVTEQRVVVTQRLIEIGFRETVVRQSRMKIQSV